MFDENLSPSFSIFIFYSVRINQLLTSLLWLGRGFVVWVCCGLEVDLLFGFVVAWKWICCLGLLWLGSGFVVWICCGLEVDLLFGFVLAWLALEQGNYR
jgi:hypothetical protein